MAEKQSQGARGRRLVRRAGDTLKTATGALTGQNVEQQVAEYSETFPQVVLGLHEDLAAASRRIGQLEANVSGLEGRVTNAQSAVQRQGYSRPLAIAALAF